jgi:hypothetical protein
LHTSVLGALIGVGVALFLFAAEYFTVRREAAERAGRKKQRLQLDGAERRRLAANARFCLLIPPAFAFFFWLVWG